MSLFSQLATELIEPLVVYDIGARWGASERWSPLGEKLTLIGFDPDPAECARLNTIAPSNISYVPVALGSANAASTLFTTREPACSSIYEPRSDLIASVGELGIMTVADQSPIDLRTLDSWIYETNTDHPHVLKLDTQGSELDILKGSEVALAGVDLLEIEVEFNPLYEGQPLFADVDQFVRSHGFELWRLGPMVHYRSDACPGTAEVGLQVIFNSAVTGAPSGSGQLFWSQAYYVRSGFASASAKRHDRTTACRVACGALGLGLDDLAELVLSRSRES